MRGNKFLQSTCEPVQIMVSTVHQSNKRKNSIFDNETTLKKIVRGVGLLISLFFSSGLEPWALNLDSGPDHVEGDDIDFLLDMAQIYEESLEPLPQDR